MVLRSLALLVAWVLLVPQVAWADSLRVLVLTGDPTPDGMNTLDFQISVRAGVHEDHVIFASPYAGVANDTGIFRGDRFGNIFTVAQSGQTVPSGKTISDLDTLGLLPSVNRHGVLAWPAILSAGLSFPEGLFRGNENVRTEVFEDGDPAPGDGELALPTQNELAAVINDSGHVAFSAALTNTTGGASDDHAIYLWDGTPATFTEIVREGDAPPNAVGTFLGHEGAGRFAPPVLNEAGQVGFRALIQSGVAGDEGVFRRDPNGTIRIAREGDVPTSGGTFTFFGDIAMNESGDVAFGAGFGSTSVTGIYRGDGTTTTEIARGGDPIPGGGDTYSSFVSSLELNDAGMVAFATSLDIFAGAEALIVGDGTSSFITCHTGTSATPGDGTFDQPLRYALNNANQLAFLAELDVGGNTEKGMFLFHPTDGLVRIARTGDALEGSTITDLDFNGVEGTFANEIKSLPDQADGLNDAGEVALAFTLADGRRGIAIWTGFATPIPLWPRLLPILLAALLLSGAALRVRGG